MGARGGKPNLDLTAGMSEGEGGGIRVVFKDNVSLLSFNLLLRYIREQIKI